MRVLKRYALLRVLHTIIKRPDVYSVRQLARIAGISPNTARLQLDALLAMKILKRDVIGKTYQYSLVTDYFLTKAIKIALSLAEISASGLVEELLERYPSIVSITLYGSVALGVDDPRSDIDILLISRKPIRLVPLKAEHKLDREVAFTVYTPQLWRRKAREDKVFYDRAILDSITLYGPKPVIV